MRAYALLHERRYNFRSPKENVVAKALRSPWTISAALFVTLMAVALLIH